MAERQEARPLVLRVCPQIIPACHPFVYEQTVGALDCQETSTGPVDLRPQRQVETRLFRSDRKGT